MSKLVTLQMNLAYEADREVITADDGRIRGSSQAQAIRLARRMVARAMVVNDSFDRPVISAMIRRDLLTAFCSHSHGHSFMLKAAGIAAHREQLQISEVLGRISVYFLPCKSSAAAPRSVWVAAFRDRLALAPEPTSKRT